MPKNLVVCLCRWREWERNLGKTISGKGDWFSRTRDGRHRVWRSARHGVVTVWGAGDGQVELKGDGQSVTGCDGRHPEAEFFISSFSRQISPSLHMEASIAVYLKHSHTTHHNIDKTREFRPKLHTKWAEMMLYFTCYHSSICFWSLNLGLWLGCRLVFYFDVGLCCWDFTHLSWFGDFIWWCILILWHVYFGDVWLISAATVEKSYIRMLFEFWCEDVASISWIFILFACIIALIEIGCYKDHDEHNNILKYSSLPRISSESYWVSGYMAQDHWSLSNGYKGSRTL